MEHAWIECPSRPLPMPWRSPRARLLMEPQRRTPGSPLRARRDIAPAQPDAAHRPRYEGTVNQVMGDGIMALFGAPIAHEDQAVRACYAALRMQESVMQYSAEIQRSHGVPVQMRVGLDSGEVVVRAIDSDLHMDTRPWARRPTWRPGWSKWPGPARCS